MSVIQLILDDDIIEDYTASFSEHYVIINNCIGMLDNTPDDEDIINEVFRSLHTIKGNADMCQLDTITQFTHALEDIVAEIRDGNIEYQPLIGEIILLSLDKTKEFSKNIFNNTPVDKNQVENICDELNRIKLQPDQIQSIAKNVVNLISGHIVDKKNTHIVAADANSQIGGIFVDSPPAQQKAVDIMPCPYSKQEIDDNALDFLRGLKAWSVLMEQKIPYWKGRLERTLPMVTAINKQLDSPVDYVQLEAALYVHDVSFAFLSNHLLQKESKFDSIDLKEMQQHPQLSANLLKHVAGWENAAKIVLQHHEKWDGSGYPNRLKQNEIHPGAQIISIIDTFESMTSLRADRHFKRSVLRAVTEINNCAGSQFNPDIVLVFNTIIKEKLKQR